MRDPTHGTILVAVGILLAAAAFLAQFALEEKSTLGLVILAVGLFALALLGYGVWRRRES